MSTIRIDADALFRAVTAASYKLLAHHLDLESGEILSRTMLPGEVADVPFGPTVQPLPKLGGDLTPRKDAAPFGPPPVTARKNLFDDEGPKKPVLQGGFWQREGKKRLDLFGAEGHKPQSSTKKLAEMFGEAEPRKRAEPFTPATPQAASAAPAAERAPDPARRPRIPVANEEEQLGWVRRFAREFGDPQIRDEILNALKAQKPLPAFERVLRKHQRMSQQWDIYFRKQALACAEAWLATLGVQWELVEPENFRL